MGGIDNLMKYFVGDELVSSTLKKFSCALNEFKSYLKVSEIVFQLDALYIFCCLSYVGCKL